MCLKSRVMEDTLCRIFSVRVIKSDVKVESSGAFHLLEVSRQIGQTESKIAPAHQFCRTDTGVNDQEVVLHEFCVEGQ